MIRLYATPQRRIWRCPDHTRKRRRTEAGESGNGTNRGRGGGNNDLVDADGFDGDRYLNVVKWRDEVVKDGMEGRVVSGAAMERRDRGDTEMVEN